MDKKLSLPLYYLPIGQKYQKDDKVLAIVPTKSLVQACY